jgi:hypothetical protein
MHSRPAPSRTPTDGPLTTGECLGLLRSVPVGRLVYTEDALPAVRPVTFAAPGGQIVIPTGDSPWFERFDGIVLAFEAGTIASTRSGWSVLAIGPGEGGRDVAGANGGCCSSTDSARCGRLRLRQDVEGAVRIGRGAVVVAGGVK